MYAKSMILITSLAAVFNAPAHAASAMVTVPGNATGDFGASPGGATNGSAPFVAAFKMTRAGTITISYKSGMVDYGGPGPNVDANGGTFGASPNSYWSLPLDESVGITSAAYPTQQVTHMAALIGAFVPANRVSVSGFSPVDNAKALAPAGLLPSDLFFVGSYHVVEVNGPGTLYLGINDSYAGDNTGAFLVRVSNP